MWQALSAQKQQYRVGYSICAIVYLAVILQFIYLFFLKIGINFCRDLKEILDYKGNHS